MFYYIYLWSIYIRLISWLDFGNYTVISMGVQWFLYWTDFIILAIYPKVLWLSYERFSWQFFEQASYWLTHCPLTLNKVLFFSYCLMAASYCFSIILILIYLLNFFILSKWISLNFQVLCHLLSIFLCIYIHLFIYLPSIFLSSVYL